MTRRRPLVALIAAAGSIAAGLAGAPPARGAVDLGLTRLASGFDEPVGIATAADGNGRLFVLERHGRIRVRLPGADAPRATPYLDIAGRVESGGGEQGLLGLAFHPDFADNGYLYVAYTDADWDLRISRFRASDPDANTVSASTERILLQVHHRNFTNHNGGDLHFGSRYLYVSTGDGGGGGGPDGNAQDLGSLLGKILRIDVDRQCGSKRYCSPSTNPFYGRDVPGRGEIFHLGLRNPWRFTLDPGSARMFIGDAGQSAWEEVNARVSPAANFGWDCREGTSNTVAQYGGAYCADVDDFDGPTYQYDHDGGRCAIVGGHVYRGSRYPAMRGLYLSADYCTGEIWTLERLSGGSWDAELEYDHSSSITAFGQGGTGEVYMVDTAGRLYRVRGS